MMKLILSIVSLLLLVTRADAQLVKEWQSPQGVYGKVTWTVILEQTSTYGGARLDFDDDGFNDITIFDRLKGGDLGIISGADPKNTRWTISISGLVAKNPSYEHQTFIGFFDVAGDKEKEIVLEFGPRVGSTFRDLAIIDSNGTPLLDASDESELHGIADFDGDDELEVLIGKPSQRVLQIWGKGN